MMKGKGVSGSLDVKKVFDVFAKRYEEWYDKPFGESAFSLEKACITSLCKNLNPPFLEVGVGTGRFANALKIEYGIDVSAEVLKFAKQKEIIVAAGKGENLPFASSFFGAVFVIVTLCFVQKPSKVLEEVSRVLKEDGSIILGLILKESPWATFYKEKGDAGNIFYQIAKFYSFQELREIIRNAALKIVAVNSTIFQSPTELPLQFEQPRNGYFKEAGFVTVKLGKRNPRNVI